MPTAPPRPEFSEKFVAFVDVLGFSEMVRRSESGEGISLTDLLAALKKLGTGEERATYATYGPTWCPCSPTLRKDLDFEVLQVSDCVIVSAEVSPAGLINLIGHCWSAAMGLLQHGLLCRGFIKRGLVFHAKGQVVGSGYQDAYEGERNVRAFAAEADDRGTPFIEVDHEVLAYVSARGDSCVKEMFSRMTESDGTLTAVFPFKRLSHDFVIGGIDGKSHPSTEHEPNDRMRQLLQSLRAKVLSHSVPSDAKAMRKIDHYVRALDKQLELCDETDRFIERLGKPLGWRSPKA